MELVRDRMKELVTRSINELIKSGKYKDLDDVIKNNPSLDEFCFNNNLKPIKYAFSTQFTNENYLELIKQLKEEKSLSNENKDENTIKETNINGNVFVDYNKEGQNETLVGVSEIKEEEATNKTIEEQAYTKRDASDDFKAINDIDRNDLNNEQLGNLNVIQAHAEANGNINNTKVYFEAGEMTNIAKVDDSGVNSYYAVDEIAGNKELVGQESSNSKGPEAKAKVKTLTKPGMPNISAAFTNTLILSFVIGSFFGIVFLAIYLKLMH